MVFDLARRHDIRLDSNVPATVVAKSFGALGDLSNLDKALQGYEFLDVITGMGVRLVEASRLGLPRTLATKVLARIIAERQRSDGHWSPGDDMRPPQSFSAFKQTALGLRLLQLFLPDSMSDERRMRVDRARDWLVSTAPFDTEDRVYQLFGLNWSGAGKDLIARQRDQLLATQQPDGGWRQLEGRASDAYATGEAMMALSDAAGVSTTSLQYQKGLRYLLRSQKPDGTWLVNTRLHAPLSPPYFETGFPYGHDQFISAAGTSWAASALIQALPTSVHPPDPLQLPSLATAGVPSWAETVLFGTPEDLSRLIATGWDVNSATSGGTSALMMAAPDPQKLSLLLDRGAKINAKSATRYTALMIAATHHATNSVDILLNRGAEPAPSVKQPAQYGANPVMLAAISGDVSALESLHLKGASVKTKMLIAGLFVVTPLSVAVMQRDLRMVDTLIHDGAAVDEIAELNDGFTSLGLAVFDNDLKMAALLLARGADVDHVDALGYTPLMWAASGDFGENAMISLLLRAGAKIQAQNREGQTAAQLALKYQYLNHIAVLQKSAIKTQ
jgi:ankyrin repeat protein